ncbi:hypothetical protein Pmani_020118 [Petrolisthes manimaculis]|uniref:Cadherin domain-containing protein n=1 Tax=Petrolisthes manimaculis TaxID=1843537 RepID=A0AAE1PGX3_9EUCA|nr:hypothetical protein Pmani_020118 [Petrolisthes manimaculis]
MHQGVQPPSTYLLLFSLLTTTTTILASTTTISHIGEELVLLRDSYNVSIYENSLARTYVTGPELIGITLSSLPSPENLTYQIVSGDTDGFFVAETKIVGGIAVLQIRTRMGQRDVLNRERRAYYTLVVEARLASASTFASTNVSVEVLDKNDNIPLFYNATYKVRVGEDTTLNTPLITVLADDADAGLNGQLYYFLQDHDMNLFAIHPTTGELWLTRPLSSRSSRMHRVRVSAQDRGPRRRNSRMSTAAQAVVEVQAYLVNLHSPAIRVQQLPSVIKDSNMHIYANITVRDLDTDDNGAVDDVAVVDGDPDALFSVVRGSRPSEFSLVVIQFLDRPLTPTGHDLTLQATDRGTPPRSSRTTVHISIASKNIQVPVFAREQYDEAVSEEAPPSTPVVRVATPEADHNLINRVQFRLVAGNQDNKFSINHTTGIIYTTDWLDHETTDYYSLTVTAIDQATDARLTQSSAKVIIRVLDANDNSPMFSTPNTEVTLDENEPSASYVTRMVATDADSGENGFISYSIANSDDIPFTIDPFDGTIRTSSVLDYETQHRVYTIKVRASDWGTPLKRESETTVKVKVRDKNDNIPQFSDVDCEGWVAVNSPIGTSIFTLTAMDLDHGTTLQYQLFEGADQGCWNINDSSGVITQICDLTNVEFANKKQFTFNVTVSDGYHISDPTSVTLLINSPDRNTNDILQEYSYVDCHKTNISSRVAEVLKVAAKNQEEQEKFVLLPVRYGYNSHTPEFSDKLPGVIQVPENTRVGAHLVTAVASDHDRGYDGRVVYSLSYSDPVFTIGLESGVVQLVGKLDYEVRTEHVLNITVYDLGWPHRSNSINLTVAVQDDNDCTPEFTRISYNINIPEDTHNGTSVTQVTAMDADSGLNSLLTYEMVSEVGEFAVDRDTGVLYVTGELDRERQDVYDLRVRAWDSATENPRSALTRVLVTILDINDCPPDFGASGNLSVEVPEDLPRGAVVAAVQAVDRDLGVGGNFTYSLVSGHGGALRIDEMTGVIRLIENLDYETQQWYNVTVRAQDRGSPRLESLTWVFIRVNDVDENLGPPVFSVPVWRAEVRENLPPGTPVTNLTARDPDRSTLTYTITQGNGLGYFSVDAQGQCPIFSPLYIS